MFSTIKGIGLYYPEKVYTNSDLQSDFPTLKVKELTRDIYVKKTRPLSTWGLRLQKICFLHQ